MLLKKIRMVGFKSFADETIVTPGPGITAVVGPNGCGKSNIVDAVRWVLGEKSGRALRGQSMEDVIFMGSETRKPGGMAEVELHFNNTTRLLHVDQDEVSIGRRIYLNSASEYLLNGKRTTRREIERIFMDTGIGKTAYSIMEQGRMSEILKASAEERRNLFDEAAGVSRFKAERAETMTRLNDTEQNLLRLNDILKSKKDALDGLERQARKTRQYLKLKEHLDRYDKNLRYLNYTGLLEKKEKVELKLKQLFEKRDDVIEKVSERETEIEKIEADNEHRVEEMHRLDREFHQDLSRMQSIKENLERLEKELEERGLRVDTLKERKQSEEKLYKEITAKVEASLQLELDMEAEIKALQGSSASIGKHIEELEEAIRISVEKEQLNNQELINIDEGQAALLEELKDVTHDLIIELETRKKDLEEKENRRIELKEAIVERLENLKTAMEKMSGQSLSVDILKQVDPRGILTDFSEYESIENEFRSFLFGKSGLLARKEELDVRMGALQERKEGIQKENSHLFEKRKLDMTSLEKEKGRKVEMELQIRDFQARRESSVEARENIVARQKETEERVKYYDSELQKALSDLDRIKGDANNQKTDLTDIEKNAARQTGAIEELKKQVEKARNDVNSRKERIRKDRDLLEKMLPEIAEQERAAESINVAESGLQEELYNDFQISMGELIAECETRNLNKGREESEYRRIKGEIVALGQFNALAIEEEKRARESYDQLLEQKKDIEEARKNITNILDDIDEKSRIRFLDTFNRIQNNFVEVFQSLFGGGNASLNLTDPQDPMNGGVEIMVQPPGKKNSSIMLLSGGEQNMTAVALMFATYLVRPSPFCLLDEIDAPLDDTNVNRYINMLSGFSNKSQFIMITHNKLSMSASEAIFGVTQEELGVSKIVSVKLKDVKDVVDVG